MNSLYTYIERCLAFTDTTPRQRAYQEALRVFRRVDVVLHEHGDASVRHEWDEADVVMGKAWRAMTTDEQALFQEVA